MKRTLIALATIVTAAHVCAQERMTLINTDTNAVLPSGAWVFDSDLRLMPGDGKNTYVSLGGYFGMANGLTGVLRTTLSSRTTFDQGGPRVRYGGTDFEANVRYAFPEVKGLTVAGGLSFPNTPAQNRPFFTTEAVYAIPSQQATAYVGARALWRGGSSIMALTGGLEARLSTEWSALGDLALMVRGNNDVDPGNGRRRRTAVYGLGVAYQPRHAHGTSFTLGLTNGLGVTNVFGNTASLGGRPGVYLGITMRG